MIFGLRALVLPRLRAMLLPLQAPVRSRRASARLALASGLLVFVAASCVLAAAVEVRHREWRDPEFGHRLLLLRERKAEAANRPLVLVVGSSRMQQGIDPSAMGFPDDPSEPLVFNFGYRGASPVIAARNVLRVLDAGVRPDYVLIEFSPASALGGSYAAVVLRKWANRLNYGDVTWMWRSGFLNPENPATYEAILAWAGSTATPWTTHRQAIVPHWLPDWVTETQWKMSGTERMDHNGFTEMQAETTTTTLFQRNPAAFRQRFARPAANPQVSVVTKRSLSLLVDRCRAEGIPVAVVQAPLSPLLTGWLNPDLRRDCIEFAQGLTRERGVAVFPPPDWLTDDDFADGEHLLPQAAARYSRWLAEMHLKPWLARGGTPP